MPYMLGGVHDIKVFLLASINSSYAKGLLSISQRGGLITLIPKKDKSLLCKKLETNFALKL